MAFYGKVLRDLIEGEKQGKHYPYSQKDRVMLDAMFHEINRYAGTNFHYLAELDVYNIAGSGTIIARYLWRLETQTARAFLVPQLVSDRIKDCDKLVLDLYLDYKKSDICTLDPAGKSSVAIYVRYDNAFRKLKPKRLKQELLALAADPQDAYRLPLTMQMLSSWKLPEMYSILVRYANSENTTPEQLGFLADTQERHRRIENIKRDLQFVSIWGLKYYPTQEAIKILSGFTQSPDKDIVLAARKTLKCLEKKHPE